MRILAFFIALHMACVTLNGAWFTPASETPEALLHPLCGGADPWFCQYDGTYYYCYSVGNGVGVKCASSLETLADAEGVTVYTAPGEGAFSRNYWAPELYRIDGRWYIYVAADDGENENHRMYVLSCDTPMGEYQMEGKLSATTDKWAIDGTLLQLNGALYFIWSGWEGDADGRQDLYIAPMDSPTRISGERVRISKPRYKWEKRGMPINEGPAALYDNGNTYVVFSASGSWTDDYCLGMLRLIGNDPLQAKNWAKCPVPVFKKTKTVFGPGHCSFVASPDGSEQYIVYHGNTESGTGWGGRSVRIQRISRRFGIPVFGKPVCE